MQSTWFRFAPIVGLIGLLGIGCGAQTEEIDPELGRTGSSEVSSEELNPRAYAPLPEGADLSRPLEALFAPDDPVVTLELRMIDGVRRARRADPAQYAEGQNPYRIRYAVYNLRNHRIAEHLADAEDEGVDVQILIEADQLARDYNVEDDYLISRGFEFAPDHRALDAARRRTADFIGIAGSGLMHLKTRIFETPAGAVVLSGSQNPGDQSVANEETLHLIRDPRLVAGYQAAYDAVLVSRTLPNAWDDAAAVNVMFTPEASGTRAGTQLLRWLEQENEQILLMVFSLRDITAPGVTRSLVQILAAKAAAGVPVYVITDRKQSDGVDVAGNRVAWDDHTEDRLRAAGVHVYEAVNAATEFTAMHHKAAVLGRTRIRVITDAANWSTAGLGSRSARAANVESVLFIDSARLDDNRTGRRYLAQWLRVLERYAAQSEARDGEPSYARVFATLTALPGWPAQPVAFTATTAQTRWGEQVFVRGDRDELGRWGVLHPGLALTTNARSYPTWTTPEPVSLPLGTRFEWKFVISQASGAGARWQTGANRVGFAAPSTLLPAEATVVRAAF